jgi:hypothetical protein
MTGMPIPRARTAIKDAPDHHDAELVLRLYDLRRETKMREARTYIAGEFWPASASEVLALARYDHPQNAFWRQVSGYWEMAYGMAKHGIVNPDYLAENTGEGFFFYAKVQPWLAELRAEYSPRAFLNTEWIATECVAGRTLLAYYRELVGKRLGVRSQGSGVRGANG